VTYAHRAFKLGHVLRPEDIANEAVGSAVRDIVGITGHYASSILPSVL
jgi:hypothetical protein